MTAWGQVDMARSQVFGEVAELYDAARPGYADALATEVLAYAAPDGRTAVEVCAGTGKATLAFAVLGASVVCIEPDPRMAGVLRRNTSRYPARRRPRGDRAGSNPVDRPPRIALARGPDPVHSARPSRSAC
ncbi:class I SAM-dependent methyltransferase [Streptomyces sp. NPDC001552]|uniref:class I SAM-dependent methyltransferase n=1 Tax=Streptomyces sp. NPDC001552 TaxID=3364587 RepID=UPI0036BDFCD8